MNTFGKLSRAGNLKADRHVEMGTLVENAFVELGTYVAIYTPLMLLGSSYLLSELFRSRRRSLHNWHWSLGSPEARHHYLSRLAFTERPSQDLARLPISNLPRLSCSRLGPVAEKAG